MTNSVSEFFPAGKDGTVDEQAAAWFAYLRSGHDTEAGRADFSAWLSEDPSHAYAYKTLKQAWEAFAEVDGVEDRLTASDPEAEPQIQTSRVPFHSRLQGWPSLAAAALIIVMLGLGVAGGFMVATLTPSGDELQQLAHVETLHFETEIGEVETVALADGSVITLSGDTAIEVRLGETRQVVLSAGQAYFDIAHDPARPFDVMAGAARVRVLGTSFDIRHGAEAVTVSVTEGRVRLSATPMAEADNTLSMLLTPNQQAMVFVDRAVRRGSFNVEHTLAWRQRRFYFEDASLCELIVDVNRFFETPINPASTDLCALRVSASFDSAQIEQTLEAVAHSLDLTLVRTPDEIRLASSAS